MAHGNGATYQARTPQPLYVQYGCGWSSPEGWVNFDASYTLRWERTPLLGRFYTKNGRRFPPSVRYGNIVSRLPVPDQSCKGIYASHVLEHLSHDDFFRALENTRRLLAPGGIFRLIVPDLEWYATQYLEKLSKGDEYANRFFIEATHLGRISTRRGVAGAVFNALNKSEHLWMWDTPSICKALSESGFVNIRKCTFGDCDDPMFSLVEDMGRFENAVAVEARC